MRRLHLAGGPRIGISGANASTFYARYWLEKIGLATKTIDESDKLSVEIAAGDDHSGDAEDNVTRIHLWDFQMGRDGNGLHAAAAAGVSWVIGHADAPPLALPVDVPEKWCGLIGANLALSALLEGNLKGQVTGRRVDVSAADTLRSFADQNSGNHAEIDSGWRRNGSTAVEHGGIFPQGYYACRDGHVGLVGRSRGDWRAIRDVIGRPAWSNEERFDDPLALARDSAEADELLSQALAEFDRDDLLQRAIQHGAPLAPVYATEELVDRDVVRQGFLGDDGSTNLPFDIVQRAG